MNTGQFLQPLLSGWLPWLYMNSYWWTAFGFLGNAMFSSRFILQWLSSEKKQRVVVPPLFWYLSFWGSVINVIYAFHVDNAPILLGVIVLPFIYGRNIVLLKRAKKDSLTAETDDGGRPKLQPSFGSV